MRLCTGFTDAQKDRAISVLKENMLLESAQARDVDWQEEQHFRTVDAVAPGWQGVSRESRGKFSSTPMISVAEPPPTTGHTAARAKAKAGALQPHSACVHDVGGHR